MKIKKLKPKKLKIGDKIAIITPSGYVSYQEKFAQAKEYFENKGLKVKIFKNAKKQDNYLGGSDKERLDDFMQAFRDETVDAIFTSRGGYGAMRILDKIDYEVIKNHPKIFVGYSDITAFHAALFKKAGLITFLAPFGVADFGSKKVDKYTEECFFNNLSQNNKEVLENVFEYKCFNKGDVSGELVGGNLTLINSLLSTPYSIDFENKILFIEDVNEPLYKIDRLLTQLYLAGIFSKVKGVLIGKFSSNEKEFENNLFKFLKDFSKKINIPFGYGFSSSHETEKNTLPLNVCYEFSAKIGNLKIVEDYLS